MATAWRISLSENLCVTIGLRSTLGEAMRSTGGRDRTVMEYRGYHAAVSCDHEACVFHGEIVGTRDVIFFEGRSVEELNKEFRFSVDDYLAMCAERGQAPDRPFSGKIPLRVSPAVHRAATVAARTEGKSLNAWIAETVERAAGDSA